jgi:hypothetical protein
LGKETTEKPISIGSNIEAMMMFTNNSEVKNSPILRSPIFSFLIFTFDF